MSVQFSRSVVSDSLQPHESQHTRPPCPSPTPRVHSDSSLSSLWCHPAISSSVIPFSSCPQSLGSVSPSTSFFIKIALTLLVPSISILIFESAYQFWQKKRQDFYGDSVKFVDKFGEHCYCNKLRLLFHEHRLPFHLFRCFFFSFLSTVIYSFQSIMFELLIILIFFDAIITGIIILISLC